MLVLNWGKRMRIYFGLKAALEEPTPSDGYASQATPPRQG